MPALLHLLCFVVAVPTVVLLVSVFVCNKADRLVTKAEDFVSENMIADGKFVEQVRKQMEQAKSQTDEGDLNEYLSENYSEKITKEFPIFSRFLNTDNLSENKDIEKKISDISKETGGFDTGKAKRLVQATVGSYTKSIRQKIKSVRRKALIGFILLQLVCFGTVFYKAGKYQSPSMQYYESNDYL